MANTDTSGLVRNTDFSAELLLNKVMNKQYRTENGNTLTLSGRVNASKLDAQSQTFGTIAGNVAKAATYADATQDALTEIASIAKKARALADQEGGAARTAMATELNTQLSALINTTVDGVSVIGGSTSVDLGLGASTITIGNGASSSNGIGALSSALSSLSATGNTVAGSTLDNVIDQLYGAIAVHGAKAELIHNRYDALNDLAASYRQASNDQVVTEGGNPTSLLNTLL